MKHIRIIRSGLIEEFAKTADVYRDRLYRVTLVSPWLSLSELRTDPLQLVADASSRASEVLVITRPPQATWHWRALHRVRTTTPAVIYTSPTLHTKLYILECDGFQLALLGSANLTHKAATENLEIGIEIRTTRTSRLDDVAYLIEDLKRYTYDLLSEDDVMLYEEA